MRPALDVALRLLQAGNETDAKDVLMELAELADSEPTMFKWDTAHCVNSLLSVASGASGADLDDEVKQARAPQLRLAGSPRSLARRSRHPSGVVVACHSGDRRRSISLERRQRPLRCTLLLGRFRSLVGQEGTRAGAQSPQTKLSRTPHQRGRASASGGRVRTSSRPTSILRWSS